MYLDVTCVVTFVPNVAGAADIIGVTYVVTCVAPVNGAPGVIGRT